MADDVRLCSRLEFAPSGQTLTTRMRPRPDVPHQDLSVGGETVAFPIFDRFRLDLPIRSEDWTIWPDRRQSRSEWVVGHPLEFRPFTWDYLHASCQPTELRLEPHYDKSTWDCFYAGVDGEVRVTAFGGLWQTTLGSQPRLREGIAAVVDALAHAVSDPALRAKLEQVRTILGGIRSPMGTPPPGDTVTGLRGRFWRWKLGAR